MSAALLVLPRVWATASIASARQAQRPFVAGARKPPQTLRLVQAEARVAPVERTLAPELAFYRKYTEGLLRRYINLSFEAGRTPSLLGREMFRGNVTHYSVEAFDDVVIFVHDVGRCLEKLDRGQLLLIRRIALEGHTQAAAAAMYGLTLRTVIRRYWAALDKLTALFLERKMLQPLNPSATASLNTVETATYNIPAESLQGISLVKGVQAAGIS